MNSREEIILLAAQQQGNALATRQQIIWVGGARALKERVVVGTWRDKPGARVPRYVDKTFRDDKNRSRVTPPLNGSCAPWTFSTMSLREASR